VTGHGSVINRAHTRRIFVVFIDLRQDWRSPVSHGVFTLSVTSTHKNCDPQMVTGSYYYAVLDLRCANKFHSWRKRLLLFWLGFAFWTFFVVLFVLHWMPTHFSRWMKDRSELKNNTGNGRRFYYSYLYAYIHVGNVYIHTWIRKLSKAQN